jgi:hypothetical protein
MFRRMCAASTFEAVVFFYWIVPYSRGFSIVRVGQTRVLRILEWWAHLDSNQGPTDYEGKTSWRHFKVFLEMAPNLLSRDSTSVQGFHGVA